MYFFVCVYICQCTLSSRGERINVNTKYPTKYVPPFNVLHALVHTGGLFGV